MSKIQEAKKLLKQYFGYDEFRQGQEQLIEAALNGQDVLGIMPTGAGKSLCFQIPALMMDGITLVISPLISLMKDQVGTLNQAGIHAAFLNSSLTQGQYHTALKYAMQGRYKIIYVAPERLEMPGFQRFAQERTISMVTVDEAHCISQWGQDFRPSYLRIKAFVDSLPSRPVVGAFTATATAHVRDDIREQLALHKPYEVTTSFDRPNLYFETRRALPSQKPKELLDLVLFGTDTAGAVVVMNPKTGEVNAIASNPSYDLNRFIKGMSGDEYKALEEQENEPLRNRAARELYPPGSTFKAFTAAAALDTGTVNENYVFTGYIDNDYWKPTGYGEWPWPRIKRTRVYHRTEPMNMTNCMLHSDNIYFADVALKIGQEKFIAYFNEKLGMDKSLPYELGAARSQLYSRGSVMDNKMLADSGYGQGQVLVTPLQLAAMFSAFANNGDMPTPRITDGLYVTDGVEYKCIRESEYSVWMEDAISTNAINKIIPMLQGVVDPNKNGTGRSLRVTNVDVAAKTGSAEIGKDKTRMYSWFAGFRLNVAQEDERVVIVMLDVPDSGAYSSLKFQIARELLKLDDTPDPNAPPAE